MATKYSVLLMVPILMYHHVGTPPKQADPIRRDLTVSTENFSQQMAWLKATGYTAVSLNDIYLAAQGQRQLPNKPFGLTFDDGYQDVFDNAVPVLKANGFTGSFGIITSLVGQPGYADWRTLVSAKKQGLELVSHTTNHFDGTNPKFNFAYIKANLAQSLLDLKQHGGIDTKILIYPYGHYDPAYLRAAQEDGFVMGLTVNYGQSVQPGKLMETPRLRVHGQEDLATFKKRLLE